MLWWTKLSRTSPLLMLLQSRFWIECGKLLNIDWFFFSSRLWQICPALMMWSECCPVQTKWQTRQENPSEQMYIYTVAEIYIYLPIWSQSQFVGGFQSAHQWPGGRCPSQFGPGILLIFPVLILKVFWSFEFSLQSLSEGGRSAANRPGDKTLFFSSQICCNRWGDPSPLRTKLSSRWLIWK